MFARHFPEFRRNHKELDGLARVKSAAEASWAPDTEVKQLGDFRVALKAESPAVSFKDLISLLRAHEILLNSLAMAGTSERDSKSYAWHKSLRVLQVRHSIWPIALLLQNCFAAIPAASPKQSNGFLIGTSKPVLQPFPCMPKTGHWVKPSKWPMKCCGKLELAR